MAAEEVFSQLAELRSARIAIPKNPKFSRADVVSAFQSAFELIGGTNRLALWANENPTEFYRLFGKLLPSATQIDLVSAPRDRDNMKSYTTEELEQMLHDMEQASNIIDITDYQTND